jgi:hypothetical protein
VAIALCGLVSSQTLAQTAPEASEPAPAELTEPAPAQVTEPAPAPAPAPAKAEAPFDLTWRPTSQLWFRPGGLLEARYTFNHRAELEGEAANTSLFSVPRARVILDGGITDTISYRLRIGVLSGGAAGFEQAYANVHLGPVNLRAGVFLLPTSVADNPSPGDLQSLDYSQYALQSGGGNSAGFGARTELGRVRVHAYLSDGLRTSFSEFAAPITARFAATARVEARLLTRDGFSRFDTESSFRGSDLALRLGAAIHYQQGRAGGTLEHGDLEQVTADVTLEDSGFNVICAARWLRIHPEEGNTTHDPGWSLQAGAFVHERIELWARYEALLSDGQVHSFPMDDAGLQDDYHGFGAGVNGYLVPRANNVKLQLAFLYVPDPIAATWAGSGDNSGLRQTETDAQWSVRTELILSL